jgi:hypothetical protein
LETSSYILFAQSITARTLSANASATLPFADVVIANPSQISFATATNTFILTPSTGVDLQKYYHLLFQIELGQNGFSIVNVDYRLLLTNRVNIGFTSYNGIVDRFVPGALYTITKQLYFEITDVTTSAEFTIYLANDNNFTSFVDNWVLAIAPGFRT